MIHPWLQDAWQRLVALDGKMPHALLFAGESGVGKRDLADALAARILCASPVEDGRACDCCAPCLLRLSGNHPDLFPVVVETDQVVESDGESVREGGVAAKGKSSQIRIEQVRSLQQSLVVTGHQSSRRVAIVHPAEAMNIFTANALLKLLEEPPEGCTLILVSSAPRRLLPTIRSRCQQWYFAPPSPDLVAGWLEAQGDRHGRALLDVSGGLPLAAERLVKRGAGPLLVRFVADVRTVSATDALAVAARWESWLKSKEALAAGFGIVELIDWMQRWVSDLAALALGGRIRYFQSESAVLTALAARTTVARATTCYNEFTRIRRVAQHPLNPRLVLEDMLLRYARAVTGPRQ